MCESSAHSQFVDYLDSNGIITQLQSGNRKFHSTDSAQLYFIADILKNMDAKKISLVVLLDMSKAFVNIRHDLLLAKLRKMGVSVSTLAWFESYVSQRTQVVRIFYQCMLSCLANCFIVPQCGAIPLTII